MKIEIGIRKMLAAALAVAFCALGTPADAGSKGSRGGSTSFTRRSSAALVRKPIAPRLPRKIERRPRIGGIQAERGSALRTRTRVSDARVERAAPKLETGRLKNVRTRVEGIRSEGVRGNGEAASRLRLQPGIRMGRTEQVANSGDDVVEAGTGLAGSASGLLTTIGSAQGANLGSIASGPVSHIVGGGALAGELAVGAGAVAGAGAAGAAVGYGIHKTYEAVAGETIGDAWYGMLDDTPSDGETEADAAEGRAAGAERKRQREAEQNGQTPVDGGEPDGQSQEQSGGDDEEGAANDENDGGNEEDGQSTDGGCDAGEQSCDQDSDDGGNDDEGSPDDGQSGADGSSTPNPEAADRNSVPIYDRVGGRLGGEEKSRQEDGLTLKRGGGYTDPTEEGGTGRFVGDSGSFVRGQQSRERKLVDQGVEAGSGGHAGAGKERKRAIQPTVQELEDLAVRGGGDVTEPPQGGEGSSSGAGGVAPGAPVQVRTGAARAAGRATGRLSRALDNGRLERVEVNAR